MAIIKLNNNALTGITTINSLTALPSGLGSDPNVKIDVARLGLRVFANQNITALNSDSISYDVFQSDDNINFTTTSGKNASNQLIATDGTSVDGSEFTINDTNYTTYIKSDPRIYSSAIASSTEANFNNSSDTLNQGSFGTKGANIWTSPSSNTTWEYNNDRFTDDYRSMLIMELTTPMRFRGVSGRWRNGSGSSMAWNLYGISADGYTQNTLASYPNISQASGNSGGMVNDTTYSSAGTWNVDTTYPYFGIFVRHSSGNGYMYDTLRITGNIPTPTRGSATAGVVTSDAITVSSTSSMGAIITYSETGTNSLNTDIVLQLSADNGSNFSTATLTALPDFASGVKCCKVSDLSVTAGTQLKYKITFANQSDSKIAKISGVSLQY
jgi:hypothetical protein